MPPRVKSVASITVEEFYDSHAKALGLELLGERVGFDRPISESAMNRPGLALAGFFTYFALETRAGAREFRTVLPAQNCPETMRIDRFRRICDRDIPCVVVARGGSAGPGLLKVANEQSVPVFGTCDGDDEFPQRRHHPAGA